MGSMQNTVYYCCVSKGGRILYAYSGGDNEIENLAVLCLERAPPYHKWYFQTVGKKTYGFLMEEGYTCFAIADAGLGKSGVLQFLEQIRDEFKKINRGLSKSMSNLNSLCLQEQLVPAICHLISSLEQVSETSIEWPTETHSPHHVGLSPSPCCNADGQIESGSSTKAPLLGKPSKLEKKKMKDHAIAMRDIQLEEHRKSSDRVVKIDSGTLDSNKQGASVSSISLQKDSMRIGSSTANIQKKWCRQVWIILAIDAALCILLFLVWLCGGTECIQ